MESVGLVPVVLVNGSGRLQQDLFAHDDRGDAGLGFIPQGTGAAAALKP